MLEFIAKCLPAIPVILLPSFAMAHSGSDIGSSFAGGFTHPITGFDHVLAMVLVGMLAARLGGTALWRVPTIFLVGMALGGTLGFSSVQLPLAEIGIASSIVVLGLMVALGGSAAVPSVMAFTGIFALFHGNVHGAEMPPTGDAFSYLAGFVAATALLHGVGLVVGLSLAKGTVRNGEPLRRILGAASALSGIAILFGTV